MTTKYQNFKEIIAFFLFDQQQETENIVFLDMGNNYLQLLTQKIVYFQLLNDFKPIQTIQQNIGKFIIDQIGISNQQHLKMCVGKLFKQSEFKKLRSIETEVKECIRVGIKKLEELQKSQKKTELKFETQGEILFSRIQNLHDNQENQTSDALIEEFLSKLENGSTALNFFIQIFGFNKAQYKCQPSENGHIVEGSIQFSHHWTNNKKVNYFSKIQDKNKKKTTEKCNMQMLSQALKNHPLLFKDFATAKKKKGIKL